MRRAFMGLLFLLFFIISPLVLLYTAGYRYDPQNNLILQTGVISIDVEPDSATVYIGDIVVQDSFPLRITNVAPGSYPVRIEATGYRTFSADLTVRSNETAFIRNLTLVADYSPIPYTTITSTNTLFSTSGKYAINQRTEDIFVTDLQTGVVARYEKINDPSFSPFSDSFVQISPASGSWQISLQTLTRAEASDEVLIPQTTSTLEWHWNKGARIPSIYTNVGNTIWRIENGRREEIGNVQEDIWYVDDRGVLWQLVGGSVLEQVENTRQTIQVEPGVVRIIDISDERALLAYSNALRIYDRRTNNMQAIFGETSNMRYSPDREMWLFTTGSELWEIADTGDVRLLERVGERITSMYAIPDSSYVAYTTPSSLVLLDTFFGLRYNLVTQASNPIIHASTSNPDQLIYAEGDRYFSIAIE